VDPESGAPEDGDERAHPQAVELGAGLVHDRDDLLRRRRIGGVEAALVAGRAALVEAAGLLRRDLAAGGVEAVGGEHVLSLGVRLNAPSESSPV
jgi:hypothetical protein